MVNPSKNETAKALLSWGKWVALVGSIGVIVNYGSAYGQIKSKLEQLEESTGYIYREDSALKDFQIRDAKIDFNAKSVAEIKESVIRLESKFEAFQLEQRQMNYQILRAVNKIVE